MKLFISNYTLPSGSEILKSPPHHILVQVIKFLVRVPVLSEQMLFAPPIISQDDIFLTKLLSKSILEIE
jgi:hypothetical protein